MCSGTGTTVLPLSGAGTGPQSPGHRTSSQVVQEITLLNPMVLDDREETCRLVRAAWAAGADLVQGWICFCLS